MRRRFSVRVTAKRAARRRLNLIRIGMKCFVTSTVQAPRRDRVRSVGA